MSEAQATDVPWMIAATIDCHDLEGTARFWSELFNMEIAGIEEPFAFLSPAEGRKVSIWLQKVPEAKAGPGGLSASNQLVPPSTDTSFNTVISGV